MQQPSTNKAALPTLTGEPTQEELDDAASLVSFDASNGVTKTPQVIRAAPQKVPRVPQTAPQKEPRVRPQTAPRKEAAPAPSTPKKNKPQTVSNATEATVGTSARSPQKMENGKPVYVCHSMVEVGPRYFSQQYLDRKNYPTNCSTCKLNFLAGKKKKGDADTGITRVNAQRMVKICQNALNHRDHECVHCLCYDCHSKENATGGRKMRKRAAVAEPAQKNKRKKSANP